jgi:hypothetical protein
VTPADKEEDKYVLPNPASVFLTSTRSLRFPKAKSIHGMERFSEKKVGRANDIVCVWEKQVLSWGSGSREDVSDNDGRRAPPMAMMYFERI